jgi:transposase
LSGCKDCAKYEKENKHLQDQIDLLKLELSELRTKIFKKKKKKPKDDENDKDKPDPKKKGGLFGHKGWFRKKPKRIHKTEIVKLKKCPCCGGKDLTEYDVEEEHIQEDIVLPEIEVTLYRKKKYYCKRCKKTVIGRGKNELLKSYIGPVAKAWAVFLKFGVKVSDRDIQKLFKAMGLKIAASSIVGFRDQLKREAEEIYDKLIESLKTGKFICIDETGARMDGDNWWRWKFSNKEVSVTHTDKSRGQKVVEKILGDFYDGVIISDFLSAYNKIITKAKQRCLVHLLRDLKKVVEALGDDEEILRYCTQLKDILTEAIKLYKEYKGKRWDKDYRAKRERIVKALKDFSFPNPEKKILVRFAKRLKRYEDELFVFLYKKGIDYHNNHAEQQIRPDVLLRKVTFGNRSEKGARVHDVVMSIFQTAKLNEMDPVKTFKDILLSNEDDPFTEILTSSP